MSLLLLFAGAGHQAPKPPAPAATVKGWFNEWDKKRRIPLELFREILKEQGNPWAKELGDAYEAVQKKKPKSKKYKKVLEEVADELSLRVSQSIDWEPVISALNTVLQMQRTTAAIKQAEAILNAFYDYDDEEVLIALLL